MGRNMQVKQTKTREVFVPFRLKPNQARGRGELGKMIKTRQDVKVQVKNWTNNSEVEFFRLKLNQARAKLNLQICEKSFDASLGCCDKGLQRKDVVQIRSERVADRFSLKRSGTKRERREI